MGLIRGFGEAMPTAERQAVRLLGTLTKEFGAFGPNESGANIKEYIEGSYAFDSTPGQWSASIENDLKGEAAHLILKGGPRGAKFSIASFRGKRGTTIPAVVTELTVNSGQTKRIGTQGGAPTYGGSAALPEGWQDMKVVRLVDTFYTTPTPEDQKVAQEAAKKAAEEAAKKAAADRAAADKTVSTETSADVTLTATTEAPPPTAWEKFVATMKEQAVPPVPNGVWVGVGTAVVVGVAVAAATMKKK